MGQTAEQTSNQAHQGSSSLLCPGGLKARPCPPGASYTRCELGWKRRPGPVSEGRDKRAPSHRTNGNWGGGGGGEVGPTSLRQRERFGQALRSAMACGVGWPGDGGHR